MISRLASLGPARRPIETAPIRPASSLLRSPQLLDDSVAPAVSRPVILSSSSHPPFPPSSRRWLVPLRAGMEPRKTPPEYFLEIFADTTTVRDVLKGVLNLIFFHRYFPSIRPVTFDVLDFTLPAINDADLETLIDSRVSTLVRQHLSSAAGAPDGKVGGGGGVRGRIAVEFYEKKRRRSNMWFGGLSGKGEEEVCWEIWTLDVTIATPRTESERAKVRKAMGNMLQKAALKILAVVNRDKDHIPPITTSESNPFPYKIVVNPRTDGWGNRIGLY